MSIPKKWLTLAVGLWVISFGARAYAMEIAPLPAEVEALLSRVPVQHNGRTKP